MSQPASCVATADDNRKKNLLPVVSFVDFIAPDLPDAVIGVAWPALRTHFDLHQDALRFSEQVQ